MVGDSATGLPSGPSEVVETDIDRTEPVSADDERLRGDSDVLFTMVSFESCLSRYPCLRR